MSDERPDGVLTGTCYAHGDGYPDGHALTGTADEIEAHVEPRAGDFDARLSLAE